MHNSGEKYISKHGFIAIKDGIKAKVITTDEKIAKPKWLKTHACVNDKYLQVKNIASQQELNTVCVEAKCPNIHECWSHGTATFMLMGSVCTRACRFCAVDTGNPKGWLDNNEPEKIARSIQVMGLRYVVLTSVNRDDLDDGGAQHYFNTVRAIKNINADVKVEVLTPDFNGDLDSLQVILRSGIDVFAHNVETVKRLTAMVRDPRASYTQSLSILKHAKVFAPTILIKTSVMLGLGETEQEIFSTLTDIREHGVDIVTLGQYLRPTPYHVAVNRYVTDLQFTEYRNFALKLGFKEVFAGPLVRSSYRADKIFFAANDK